MNCRLLLKEEMFLCVIPLTMWQIGQKHPTAGFLVALIVFATGIFFAYKKCWMRLNNAASKCPAWIAGGWFCLSLVVIFAFSIGGSLYFISVRIMPINIICIAGMYTGLFLLVNIVLILGKECLALKLKGE